ncbi:hypothetical protein S40288_04811 [Stachybotrys chartarum IBT 40288]|nr:hypothetical protein S40288_04811 [Stachybotrys chartarum IBT 40288]
MPLELPFVTLDVFTRTRFRGNPLAVVTIPAGTGPDRPSQEEKLAIAREFNLSETVFVHDEANHDVKQRRIDIFLPYSEIPFAGHPVIGTAVSLLPLGVDTLITKAGPISILPTASDAVQADIPHNVHLHVKRLRDLGSHPSLNCLSSVPEIRQAQLQGVVFSIVHGMNFILVELPSLQLLAQVKLIPAHFPTSQLLDEGWGTGFIGTYFFVRTSASRLESDREHVSLRTRLVEDTFEDPATGSAACALSSYLSLAGKSRQTQSFTYDITQGVEMGKESHIAVEVRLKDADSIHKVSLSGPAVKVMQGSITL